MGLWGVGVNVNSGGNTVKWTPGTLVVIMLLLHGSCYAIGPDTSSWTNLETRIGNHVFSMSVPGKASIKPYYNIEDPALYENNPGAHLISQYWPYNGFRKEYGGVSCSVGVNRFLPEQKQDLKSFNGLKNAVESARKFRSEQLFERYALPSDSSNRKNIFFDPSSDWRQHDVNGTKWVRYSVSKMLDADTITERVFYVAVLDSRHYIHVGIAITKESKQEKKFDKWLPKAEALAREIAASLQVAPLPDQESNAAPSGGSSPPSASARPEQEAAVRTPKGRRGMHGTLSGNRYTFPGGLFDCTVPPYSGERGMSDFVHENGGNVTFWNQFKLERTDCVRFEPEDHETFRASGIGEKLYKSFFDEAMLPAVYAGMPDAELQFTGMVPIGDKNIGIEHLFLAYMRLPHQGNAIRWENDEEIKGDAYRAWLIYAADGYFFSLSSQVQTDLEKDRWIQVMTSAFQRYSFGRWWERE